ncbi:MAG: DUF2207 domain-containing protein [Alphaproteobacteria bacterium]|nr:DUF2207 domain-containing protein [Alphaproteobacteria bacterium]
MRAVLTALLFLGLLATASNGAAQRERILSFSSDVTVRPDGILDVEETIEVIAAGDQIRRGIFRDFPIRSLTAHGFNHIAGFEVVRITRDGRPEPHFLAELEAGVRVYIGREDVLLDPGVHRYTIAYQTSRQLLHRSGEDELYWNVTGDAWAFPIDLASVSVRLPGSPTLTDIAAYTGSHGERGRDAAIVERGSDLVRIETTRGLAPGEGFTIAVAWPAGAVSRPTASDELSFLLADNAGVAVGSVLLVVLLIHFAAAWHRVGRDPRKGVVIPLFEAPGGLSPTAVGFIWGEGHGDGFAPERALTVALTSLATKRAIVIEEVGKGEFEVDRDRREPGDLPPGEKALLRTLLPAKRGPVRFGKAYEPRLGAAKSALLEAFDREFSATYFRNNIAVWLAGAMIAVACVGSSIAIDAMGEDSWVFALVASVFLCGFLAAGLVMIGQGAVRLLSAGSRGYRPFRALLRLALGIACLIPVGGVAILIAVIAPPVALVPAVGAVALTVLFWFLMKAPTRQGRETLDAIEGYRLYLSVAEADRLNFAGREPEVTEALFEAHLPYAMALGVEEEWTGKALARIEASAADPSRPRREYRPRWYHAAAGSASGSRSLASALSQGLGGAAATASTRPSSSGGGSSSGGFSGGGGGGGGGGGW